MICNVMEIALKWLKPPFRRVRVRIVGVGGESFVQLRMCHSLWENCLYTWNSIANGTLSSHIETLAKMLDEWIPAATAAASSTSVDLPTISLYINCIISILIHSLAELFRTLNPFFRFPSNSLSLAIAIEVSTPILFFLFRCSPLRLFVPLTMYVFSALPTCWNVSKLQPGNKSMTFEMHCISQF